MIIYYMIGFILGLIISGIYYKKQIKKLVHKNKELKFINEHLLKKRNKYIEIILENEENKQYEYN